MFRSRRRSDRLQSADALRCGRHLGGNDSAETVTYQQRDRHSGRHHCEHSGLQVGDIGGDAFQRERAASS